MYVTGLLGGLFVRRLALAMVPGVWLALAVGCPLARLTAVTAAIAIVALPAVLALSVVHEALELVIVPRLELVAVLVLRLYANLFVAELAERTVSHSRVETAFKILCETREHFVAELAPATEVLRAIAAVKGPLKPFHL